MLLIPYQIIMTELLTCRVVIRILISRKPRMKLKGESFLSIFFYLLFTFLNDVVSISDTIQYFPLSELGELIQGCRRTETNDSYSDLDIRSTSKRWVEWWIILSICIVIFVVSNFIVIVKFHTFRNINFNHYVYLYTELLSSVKLYSGKGEIGYMCIYNIYICHSLFVMAFKLLCSDNTSCPVKSMLFCMCSCSNSTG